MTERVGTVATPLAATTSIKTIKQGVHIGRVLPAQPSQFIGARQFDLGFGEDASADFVEAFLKAMVAVEFHPLIRPKTPPARANAIQDDWSAKIKGYIKPAPTHIVRHDHGRVFWATSGQEAHTDCGAEYERLFRFTHAEYVQPFVPRLIPQLIPEIYALKHITTERCRVTKEGTLHQRPGWRYQVMAHLLVYEMLPNLRTTEMLKPADACRKLDLYFRDVHNVYGHWTPVWGQDKRERASFLLAVYERTLCLLNGQWQNDDWYRKNITERESLADTEPDQILSVAGGTVNLEEARSIRRDAYNELLLYLLGYCHTNLCGLK